MDSHTMNSDPTCGCDNSNLPQHRPMTPKERRQRDVLNRRLGLKTMAGQSLTDCEAQYTLNVLACYDAWEKTINNCTNSPDPELCEQTADEDLNKCLEVAYLQYLACMIGS